MNRPSDAAPDAPSDATAKTPSDATAETPSDATAMLRALKVLQGPFLDFDVEAAPDEPVSLFMQWLAIAVDHGVPEPHAMTLSTVDADGMPDARVLILKDVEAAGFSFAVSAASRKGRQLAAHPQAALTFHWKELARQVRIRGAVIDRGDAVGARDLLARPKSSRAGALVGRQSDVLADPGDLADALAASAARIEADPACITPLWRLNVVRPVEVEFWQGAATRRHTRLRYRRNGGAYVKERLWP